MNGFEKLAQALLRQQIDATQYPIELKIPLGDGNWNKQYVTLRLHVGGHVEWDYLEYESREKHLNTLYNKNKHPQ